MSVPWEEMECSTGSTALGKWELSRLELSGCHLKMEARLCPQAMACSLLDFVRYFFVKVPLLHSYSFDIDKTLLPFLYIQCFYTVTGLPDSVQ